MTAKSLAFLGRELLRGTIRRGLLDCTRIAWSMRGDVDFDRRFGIETAGLQILDGHELAAEPNGEAMPYRGVRVRPFRALLQRLGLDRNLGFVDFGAGKGRAMILAAEYGFKSAVGVEFSRELTLRAEENWRAVRHRYPRTKWRMIHADATEYLPAAQDGVFFSYDSFGLEAVRGCLAKINASFAENPRPVHWIYHNNFLKKFDPPELAAWNAPRTIDIEGNRFFVRSRAP